MSDNNTNKVIEEYEAKKSYYDGLRDDITNLEKSINDMKASIKNTIGLQNKVKEQNYQIWSNLEVKDIQPKTTEKEPDISTILENFR